MRSKIVAAASTFALSATLVAPSVAGVTISTGVANLSIFGPAFDLSNPSFNRSDSFNGSFGPVGPITLTRPGAGVPNTKLSLSDFTASGFSLVESGNANLNWSAFVAFAFTPTVDLLLEVSGTLFGDSDSGLAMGIEVVEVGATTPELFTSLSAGSFASTQLTLQAGVQYGITYQSNYGLGGGAGNGSLLNFSLAPVPAPGALALISLAGLGARRRRRD